MHPLAANALEQLNEADVAWCLLPQDPAQLRAEQTDIYVRPSDTYRVESAWAALGFLSLATSRMPASCSRSNFVAYDQVGVWVRLSIHTSIRLAPGWVLHANLRDGCLDRRMSAGNNYILSGDDRFWIETLRYLLEPPNACGQRRSYLRQLLTQARVDSQIAQAVDASCPSDWSATKVVDAVRNDNWTGLDGLSSYLRRAGSRTRSLLQPVSTPVTQRIYPWCLLRNVRRLQGVSVAVVGPDGAGKSTLAAAIASTFVTPVRLVYMGMGHDRPKLLARLDGPGLFTIASILTAWCRYASARYYQLRGDLVIFDRFHLSSLTAPPPGLSRIERAARWVRGRACPMPDMVLVLDVPGEVMFARKGERNIGSLEEERQRLLSLRHKSSRVQVIDNTRPPDVVRTEVLHKIWRQYLARVRSG